MSARKKTSSLKWLFIVTIAIFSITGFKWWWSEEEQSEKPAVKEEIKKPAPEQKPTVIKQKDKKITQKKAKKKKPTEKKTLKTSPMPTGKVSELPVTTKPVTPPTTTPTALPTKITTTPTAPPAANIPTPSAPMKSYTPLTAQGLRGIQTPARRPKTLKELPKAKNMYEETSLEEIPEELSEDKSNMIGQAFFPDGSKLFIVYDEENNPTKILNIDPNGKKTIKLIGSDKKVQSIEKDGRKLSVEYIEKDDGTQTIFKNKNGDVVQKKYFNKNGLLIRETDQDGKEYTYRHIFKNGSPVTFEKIDSTGKTVKKDSISNNEKMRLSSLTFQTKPSVKAYTYKYDDKGNVKFVIENKGLPEEVIREFNDDGQLVSIYNKKTDITYLYEYDSSDQMVRITIISSDGSKKTIERGDTDFDMILNEFSDFNPIAIGDSIQMHKKSLEYSRENMLNKQIQESIKLQKMHTQKDFTAPKPPQSVNEILPPKQPVTTKSINFQPKSAPAKPVQAPSVPKKY